MNGDSVRWPHLARRHDIVTWAQRVDAPADLPRLVRQLVDQTNDQVVELQMRADEGVRLQGYDGVSRALRGSPFVPEGFAVWEMGTSDDPKGKADDDYSKRTADPLGVKPEETTFVFVTPRSWPSKGDWANEKRVEGAWGNVVALDVDDIDQAFERAPAAHVWFSELVGVPAQGAQSLTRWWDRFSQLSSPPLTPALVLAGRADAAAALLLALDAPPQVITVSAQDEEELLVFVAAVVLSGTDPDRVRAMDSRSIIVKDAYSLQRLEYAPDSLVLVPYHDELRREARLVKDHHVVLRTDEGGASIDIPPIDIESFQAVLLTDGVPEQRALELARLAHRSIYAFQRATPVADLPAPSWVDRLNSPVARRAWLVGRWDQRRSGDTDALAELFARPYDAAQEELLPLATGTDPLLVRVGETWTVTSVDDAWRFGHSRLDVADLTAYEALIQVVLASVDPRLELPIAERWMAGIYGKTPIYSGDLRRGVAEMLALFGGKGLDVSVGAVGIQTWLHGVLRRLFARANDDLTGQLWASLTDVLPMLAEAAPDVFLQALDVGLEGDRPLLRMMFADNEEANPLSISSPHTGLLWALETVAWSSEHFGQVVEQLTRLAEVDPGGRLSNRPAESLASIFRPWLPQTSATPARRLAVLDAMRERHNSVAWQLMLSMLPETHAVGSYTPKPKFRAWASDSEATTRADAWATFVAVAERLIGAAGTDPARWAELVRRFDDLPEPTLAPAIAALRSAAAESSDVRASAWEPLRDLVARHRRFAHADWALDRVHVDELDLLQEELAPTDAVERARWLFDDHVPDIPEEGGRDIDGGQILEAVQRRRVEAVTKLHDVSGPQGVVKLAGTAKYPWFVGDAAARAGLDDVGDMLYPSLDAQDEPVTAARAWVAYNARTRGWPWVEEQLGRLKERPVAQARVLLEAPDIDRAWEVARRDPAVDAAYWSEFLPYGRGPAFALAERAARELLAHDRPRAALMLLNLYLGSVEIDADLVVEALERFVATPIDQPDRFRVDSHELERLLEFARGAGVDEERLMLLEWRLLPALGFDVNSPVLERRLAREPEFFVEVLSLCFKPSTDESDVHIPAHVATNAYRLLDEWSIVPGSDGPQQAIAGDRLNAWVDAAIPLLGAADREAIGLELIGRVLAKAPGDPDETWPTRPVRDLIERLRRTELDRGFEIEVLNSRGVTSRGLTDGGEQERLLAKRYATLAQRVADEWPRTSTILRSLAATYEEDARREDAQVRRFLEGLDR